MPVTKNRHNFIKIWRPPGTRITEGQFKMPGYQLKSRTVVFGPATQVAMDRAFAAFAQEFRRWPDFNRMTVELTMMNGVASAIIVELPEED